MRAIIPDTWGQAIEVPDRDSDASPSSPVAGGYAANHVHTWCGYVRLLSSTTAVVHRASYMVCCAQRYPILLSFYGPESTVYGLLQSEKMNCINE